MNKVDAFLKHERKLKRALIVTCVLCGTLSAELLQPVFAGKGSIKGKSVPVTMLTPAEVTDLLFMREEEKLARDVYHAMHELYGQRVFTNIARAEQRHMDAILGLLDAYGLNDPCKEAGRFGNQELQKLYDMLVAGGRKSREEAFLIGALIEEVDIADLMEAMAHTDKDEIHSVYSALLGGSKRHLNAFVRNYESVSQKPYQAQNLMQEQVDEIMGR